MNILGIGPAELVLIFVIALIVFGPGRLPELARTLGKAMGELKRMSAEVTAEFARELQDVEDVTREMKETTETIKQAADIKTLVESVEPPPPATSPSTGSGHRTAGESREEPESPHVQETTTQPGAEKEETGKGERD